MMEKLSSSVCAARPYRLWAGGLFAVLFCLTLLLSTVQAPVEAGEALSAVDDDYVVYLPLVAEGTLGTPISQSGGRIVYVGFDRLTDREIYVMNADGGATVQLTDTAFTIQDLAPAWAPDGATIAFQRVTQTGTDHGIYVMNDDGSDQVRRSTGNAFVDGAPNFSPDGSKIVFDTSRNGIEQIMVMNADGSGQVALTEATYRSIAPHWSPDGSKIVYASMQDVEENGRFEIFVMNTDGSGKTRLTNFPNSDDTTPRWSPDGTRILFSSLRSGQEQIFVMDTDGSNQTPLTTESAILADWSPDGSEIVYTGAGAVSGDVDLYLMDADGGNVRRLTNTPNMSEFGAKWSR